MLISRHLYLMIQYKASKAFKTPCHCNRFLEWNAPLHLATSKSLRITENYSMSAISMKQHRCWDVGLLDSVKSCLTSYVQFISVICQILLDCTSYKGLVTESKSWIKTCFRFSRPTNELNSLFVEEFLASLMLWTCFHEVANQTD